MTNNNDEPTFEVQVIDYGSPMTVLVPQFQPSDLSEDEWTAYEGLRKAGKGHHTGAVSVNKIAAGKFEAGEEVTLREAGQRYIDASGELVDELQPVLMDFFESIAPIMREMVEAFQPVAETLNEERPELPENADTDR